MLVPMPSVIKLDVSPVRPNKQAGGASELRAHGLSIALHDEWHAVGATLELLVWRAGRWTTIDAAKGGRALFTTPGGSISDHVEQCVVAGETLLAVTRAGAVVRFDGKGWARLASGPKGFGNRSGFRACFDPSARRMVIWGGGFDSIDPVDSDETFFFADGAWSTPGRASPPPPDLEEGAFLMFFDHSSGRVVRLGRRAVGVLEDDRWRTLEPAAYAGVAGPVAFAASDARSRQTLVIRGRKVHRFGLEACEQVAELEPLCDRSGMAYARVYLPERRELHFQDCRVAGTRGSIALGPVFDRAAGIASASPAVAPSAEPGASAGTSSPRAKSGARHAPPKVKPPVPAVLGAKVRATLTPFFSSLCTLELPRNLGGACNAYVFDWAGLRERYRQSVSEFLIGLKLEHSVPFAVRVRFGGLQEMRESYGGSRSRWTLGHYLNVAHDGVLAQGEKGGLYLLDEGSLRAIAPSLVKVKLKKGVLPEDD
jgi:hypothetical protein